MPEPITPADLSRELDVSQRSIRAFLRAENGKLNPPMTRWELTEEQAAKVLAHFRAKR